MKARILTALLAVIAVVLSTLFAASPAHAQSGFYVSDGRLYEANGNEFIIRGVSHPHVWYTQHTHSYAGIASHGANTVRVVLGSGQRWGPNSASDVANVIELCKQNQLICMLEVHDTTGYGEEGDAATLDQAVDYWISLQNVLQGEEDYVLINIGNEPYGNNQSVNANWASDTQSAINRLRNAGFTHTLVVDAPNWGQDWQQIMLNEAENVVDPQGDTVFSIHMYGVYEQASTVTNYLNSFRDRGLPIMVGEFGHNHSDGNPDEDAIMATSESLGIGYVGWSWSGNSGGVEYLDMVNNFNADSLTPWGERIFYGPDGIADTARTATIYTDGEPGNGGPGNGGEEPSGDCSANFSTVGEWQGGFQGEVRVTAGNAGVSGWEVSWTYSGGQGISNIWNGDLVSDPPDVTVRNMPYNATLGAGQSTAFGFIGSGSAGSPTLSCRAI